MKLTAKRLQCLGAIESTPGCLHLVTHGIHLVFKARPNGVWDFEGHPVTDLEEVIGFAYRDGRDDGKETALGDVREALGLLRNAPECMM